MGRKRDPLTQCCAIIQAATAFYRTVVDLDGVSEAVQWPINCFTEEQNAPAQGHDSSSWGISAYQVNRWRTSPLPRRAKAGGNSGCYSADGVDAWVDG